MLTNSQTIRYVVARYYILFVFLLFLICSGSLIIVGNIYSSLMGLLFEFSDVFRNVVRNVSSYQYLLIYDGHYDLFRLMTVVYVVNSLLCGALTLFMISGTIISLNYRRKMTFLMYCNTGKSFKNLRKQCLWTVVMCVPVAMFFYFVPFYGVPSRGIFTEILRNRMDENILYLLAYTIPLTIFIYAVAAFCGFLSVSTTVLRGDGRTGKQRLGRRRQTTGSKVARK